MSSLWCRGKGAALCSATQHAMPPEFGSMWETECLNTRFPLPTLLCAGYSVKLINFIFLTYYFIGYNRDRLTLLNIHSKRNKELTHNARIGRKLGNKSVSMETECLNTMFPGSLWLSYYV